MPKIPSKQQFDTFRPSSVRPTADDFGAIEGRSLSNVGQVANQLGQAEMTRLEEIERENNRKAAIDLDNQFTQRRRELLHDPDTGFYNQKGESAIAAYGQVQKDLEKIRQELIESNPRARVKEAFDMASAQRMEQELKSINTHAAREQDAAFISSAETRIEEAVNDGIVYPERSGFYSGAIAGEVAAIGKKQGWDKDRVALETLNARTTLHASSIDNMLVEETPQDAMNHFQFYKDEISPQEHDRILARIQSKLDENQGRSFRDARDVMSFVNTFGRLPDNFEDVMGRVSGIPSEKGQQWTKDLSIVSRDVAAVYEFSQQPVSKQAEDLRNLRNTAGSADEVGLFKMANASFAETQKAAANGTLLELDHARGERTLIDVTGDFADLPGREVQANLVAAKYGVPVNVLTPDEMDGLVADIDSGNSDMVASRYSQIITGFSPEAVDGISDALADERPAHAVALSVARDNPRTAEAIIRGDSLAKSNPDLNPEKIDRIGIQATLSSAFSQVPEAVAPYVKAATAIYVGQQASGNDEFTLEDALVAVAPMYDHNGVPTLLPPNMSSDDFSTFVQNVSLDELEDRGNGKPVFADGTPFEPGALGEENFLLPDDHEANGDAHLVTVGHGQYQIFVRGIGPVMNDEGDLYILDLRG